MVALIDMTGKRFGRWTVLSIAESVNKKRLWNCVCDCGVERKVVGDSLRSGHSVSCGCFSADSVKKRLTKHGMTDEPLHRIWRGMLTRCNNKNVKCYPDYGGRGISVCGHWKVFENFYADMHATYSPGLTIERINNDLGYSPENCKWVEKKDQSKNRRSVVIIDTPDGKMSLTEAAQRAGISWFAMRNRVRKNWPIDRLFEPSREARKNESSVNDGGI